MRHIAVISKHAPVPAQTNFQALLDGILAIVTSLFTGIGSILGDFEVAQGQSAFKSIFQGDGDGDIGEGF